MKTVSVSEPKRACRRGFIPLQKRHCLTNQEKNVKLY